MNRSDDEPMSHKEANRDVWVSDPKTGRAILVSDPLWAEMLDFAEAQTDPEWHAWLEWIAHGMRHAKLVGALLDDAGELLNDVFDHLDPERRDALLK